MPAAPTAGVRLAQAADAVEATIALAARNGQTQARIQLSPAALGDIQIHLQHTDAGIVARVVTARPEAAATLAQNGDDLRHALEQGGTALLALEISTSGRSGHGGHDASDTTAEPTDEEPLADDADPAPTPILGASPAGTPLVNILA